MHLCSMWINEQQTVGNMCLIYNAATAGLFLVIQQHCYIFRAYNGDKSLVLIFPYVGSWRFYILWHIQTLRHWCDCPDSFLCEPQEPVSGSSHLVY